MTAAYLWVYDHITQITRGHPFKLRVQHCRIDARKYFFSLRVIDIMALKAYILIDWID